MPTVANFFVLETGVANVIGPVGLDRDDDIRL